MTRPPLRSRILLVLVLVVGGIAACSGPAVPAAREPGPADPSPAAATSPWDELGTEQLAALVVQQATARISEVEPDLDVSQIPGWVAEPDAAPALGDRVCEQLSHLAIAAAATGDDALAQGLVALVRQKARNRNNAFTGTTLLSELARRGASTEEAQRAAVSAVLDALPRNRFGGATVVFQLFQNEGQINAQVQQLRGQLVSLDTAVSMLFFDTLLRPIVANRSLFLGVIEQIRTARASEPEPAAYAFSTVDLEGARDTRPVVVAVWDTGVAGDLFGARLFENDGEQPNGEDDDGNGLIDDIHGVISDPTEGQDGLTFDPGAATITEFAPFLQGIMDLRAGLASTEAAQRVLQLMGSVEDAEALERLSGNLDAIGEWAHGTHVAGIMLAGVPQARLAVFRSAWAGEARVYHHRGPTDAELAAERQNIEEIARFINAHDVQVVNASLGFGQDYVEAELRHESSRYQNDAQVRARAAQIHAQRRANWQYVFEQCPNTLFVVAAGNSNRDVVEYGDVPAALTLPNLLVVGAVDRFGNWATFTSSNPEQVTVFDHGVEVPSLIPNGDTVPLSGTSMASPNVANLATKLLSVNGTLTPAELITIIRDTGEPIAAPFYGRVAHEARAIAQARRRRGRSRGE